MNEKLMNIFQIEIKINKQNQIKNHLEVQDDL